MYSCIRFAEEQEYKEETPGYFMLNALDERMSTYRVETPAFAGRFRDCDENM
jgi:hypothetical protein